MKKLIALVLVLATIFALAACSFKEKYRLEFFAAYGDYEILNDVDRAYAAGDEVTIQLATVTEQYYIVYVNGTEIPRDDDASDMEYSFYTFTMPAEDVVVKIETKGAQMMPVSDVRFTADDDGKVISTYYNYGTEYVSVGVEGRVWCFGEQEFVGHIEGEKTSFTHLGLEIKTGMYSVDGNQDVMVRYFPDNEFASIYVKKDLLRTEVSLDNCTKLGFVKDIYDAETAVAGNLITECEQFLNEIKGGQRAKEAGLYDLVRQPNGMLKNCYVYGYICGVIQDDVNIVIPMTVTSFDDKAYSVTIDDVEYVLQQKWLDIFEKKNSVDYTSPVFSTRNISRITFYGYYGEGKGVDVSADDMAEIVAWLGTFTLGKAVGGDVLAPGTNTYYVEIEYADGAIVKNGLDVIKVYGTSYYLDSDIPPDCFMDIIYEIRAIDKL